MKRRKIDDNTFDNTFINPDTLEEFKRNKEYPFYWAGNQGNVYSEKSQKCLSNKRKNKEGYVRITLPDGKQTTAHRFICLTWNDISWSEASGYVVHHCDSDKTNNRLSNLQLLLKQEHKTVPIEYWVYYDIQDFSEIYRKCKKNKPACSMAEVAKLLDIDSTYQLRKRMKLWKSQNGYALYRVDGHEEVIFTKGELKV